MADQAQVPAIDDQSSKAAAKAQAKADRAAAKEAAKAERKRQRDEKEKEYALEQQKLLKDLKLSVKAHARMATFACGGSVSFKTKTATVEDGIEPVDIRFGENGKGLVLTLPLNNASSKELGALVKACQPATFGRGNEEVHDEDYRKAGKLDRTAFATTFCPYEAGIIDVVSQLLVPQAKHDKHHCSIKAELYKLNVYSAPSGKFKAHVDTPRSEAQIGSLVVSLPVDHEGGQLAVRNAGKELLFDWSASANKKDGKTSVKWAAFYSDCEHEVYEVTSGHRITLTYNLYVTRGLGHLAGTTSRLNPTQLPLYDTLKTALDSPGFLRHGRVLAIWLNHSYAHTNTHLNFLPSSLKGADMSLYETARALGLWCKLGPIITTDWGYDDESSHRFDDEFSGFNDCDSFGGNLDPEGGAGFGYSLPEGMVTWVNPFPKKKGKGPVAETEAEKLKEAQMAYMTYGNEPGIDIWYSRAVMLIRVPPFRLRGSENPKNFWSRIRDDWAEDDEYYDFDDCEDYEGYHGYTEDEDDEDDSGEEESDEDMDDVEEK